MTSDVPEITIDLMELADLGQPLKLAFELHRQIRAQLGAVPLRVPLEQIATALGIVGIREYDTDNFEGTLVISDGVGAVGLRKGMPSGRRNFTLGHEIGHFAIPSHRMVKAKFECSTSDLRRARPKDKWEAVPHEERIEIEANEFSAALVVPMPEYRAERRKLSKACDLEQVRVLARKFDVSLEVMAKVYVTSADELAAIVISKDRKVQRVIPAPNFPYLGLRAGAPIPELSLTHRWPRPTTIGTVSEMRDVPTHAWLEKRGRVEALYEQVFAQKNGYATTLLTVDMNEDDAEDDDRHWNRR
ncbi:ImmA/IrrE family metallo-endopeptidase [Bradyrhizobium sp. SEMIA]|uniref:ImmA/IrrE family metallo-endopeptidase n=1 Tax=Bradyrhizobium sp. SEMIA TaxID=2597515 RepID=UPI0018A4B14D|nr:ImmA/IrrE family metallo-endopeptidase [Bradyrhizobium sp. SEMIA]QOG19241.1 ImmA/IrrE family metallo-endopeptidase [Bradyrhizobium sp. SEMIA]